MRFTLLIILLLISCETKTPELKSKELKPKETRNIRLNWPSFEEMHAYYTKEFVEARGFGISRVINMNDFKFISVKGKEYKVRNVDLFSTTDRDSPVLWYGAGLQVNRRSIEKGLAKSRPLTEKELTIINKFKDDKRTLITMKENSTILLAGLHAQKSCLRCHDDKKVNDLMGAFKYTLIPVEPFK